MGFEFNFSKDKNTYLKSIVQLGEPGAGCSSHDVSLLLKQSYGLVSIHFLNYFQSINIATAFLLFILVNI